jgi:hypothetical protein
LGYDKAQLLCPPIQMLRRTISTILVLALIGYGTSWAFSGHALDDVDHASGGLHEHTHTALDESGCDHCCHASAHMTGLAPPFPKLPLPHADSFRLVPGCIVATRVSTPLLKPPRS